MTKNVIIGLLVAVCIIALIYGQYQNVLEDRAALEASAQREKAEECAMANEKLNERLEQALADAEQQSRLAEKALNDLKKGR